jgi:NDP-sugar pyrophosphorylase family protein
VSAVRTAVLLAAGRGSRLGDLTANFPKPLLEVGGQPILFRAISGLSAAGIRDFVVITGHAAEMLEEATGSGERWGARIRYIRQPRIEGTAAALRLARPFLGQEPFFVGWGDIVVGLPNYAAVVHAAEATGAALAVNDVDDPWAGAAVYVDEEQYVTNIVEKPGPGTSTTRWNNAGLAVLPPSVWPYVDALEPSERGEYELPSAIAGLVRVHRTRAVPIEGPWFDIGTPESLAAARAHFGG